MQLTFNVSQYFSKILAEPNVKNLRKYTYHYYYYFKLSLAAKSLTKDCVF